MQTKHMKQRKLKMRGQGKLRVAQVAFAVLAAVGMFGVAGAPREARANAEFDRQYALENVGVLRAWDNVDGLFSDYVLQAFRDYFAKQSRFNLQDLSKADALLGTAKIPYYKLIEDTDVLRAVSRSLRVSSLLRTRVYKEGSTYRFKIEWLHAPSIDLIASEEFKVEQMGDVNQMLQQAAERLVKRLPFRGQVTGRDDRSVTLDLGEASGIKAGDTAVISTIEEVKRHPLLHAIVDWRFAPVGRVKIEQVDEKLAFGKVEEEDGGRPVARYQKVVDIIPPSEVKAGPTGGESTAGGMEGVPALGWILGGLDLGGYSRDVTTSANGGKSGSGIYFGGKARGQLWFTSEWFAEAALGFGLSSYSQQDIGATGGGHSIGGGMSESHFEIAGGYNFLPPRGPLSSKAWVKFGYHSANYNLPIVQGNSDATSPPEELTAPGTFKGLVVGLGAELPLRGRYGMLLGFDFGFLNSVSAPGLNLGSAESASDVRFFLGGYYRFDARMSARFGLDVASRSADFKVGASLSEKIISFGPSLQYYF